MTISETILNEADCIENFKYYLSRQKSYGRMWGGGCVAYYKDLIFYYKLWSHINAMTKDDVDIETIKSRMSIRGIVYQGKFYAPHWHAVFTDTQIWLHKKGWFGEFFNKDKHPDSLHRFVHTKVKYLGDHWNNGKGAWDTGWSRTDYSDATNKDFTDLGFELILTI